MDMHIHVNGGKEKGRGEEKRANGGGGKVSKELARIQKSTAVIRPVTQPRVTVCNSKGPVNKGI